MNPTTQTSAGNETVDQTVARAREMLAGGQTAPQTRGEEPVNPILEALTERLTRQSEGISSSASSQLQATIAEAIGGVQQAGDANRARLLSERDREVAFARDRAGATYTTALEGRTGYATQVVALRELTETTEKSVRDLDARYQEAILANDAATAGEVARLRMQKLEFLQQQEQNFYTNMFSLGNLQQSAIDSMMRREEFWESKEQNERQFMLGLKQSDDQFTRNLSLQYQELGLKEQELDIARERNQLSREEFNLRKSELNKTKEMTATKAMVQASLMNLAKSGGLGEDPIVIANVLRESAAFADFNGSNEEFNSLVFEVFTNVRAMNLQDTPDTDNSSGFFGSVLNQSPINLNPNSRFPIVPSPGLPIFNPDRLRGSAS